MSGYVSIVDTWRNTERIALTTDTEQLSYRDWAERGERLAKGLLGAGIERPARVAVALPNGPDFAIALYACARIGVTFVPISTWATGPELHRILAAAAPDLVITSNFLGTQLESFAALAAEGVGPGLRRMFNVSRGGPLRSVEELVEMGLECSEDRWDRAGAAGSDEADLTILYTSGSTGLPKGVILRQGTVRGNGAAIAARMGLDESSRIYSYFPMFFSGGLCNSLSAAASVGAELVTQARYEPASAARLIRSRRCTARNVWHDGFDAIASSPDFFAEDLRRMHRGLIIDPSTLTRLGLPFDEGVNMYGMTETATAFAMHDFRETADVRRTTHGAPLPGNEVRTCEPGSSDPVAPGREGEICVRGRSLMRAYTDGSDTALTDEDGFFHTGDLGFVDDIGHVHYTGRLKTLIKVRGLTIQPEEIEAVLLRHPSIHAAVVVGVGGADESTGLRALVAADVGTRAVDIDRYCRAELSSYKVPRVQFIEDHDFPWSASRKIDRRAAAMIPEARP
ncbi:class I adenylate-forming enzyme family protein [Cryobacterium aureum]|uniref:class I adenylate-forming enzyme family protein n=1 Tax=Cryobacterium aureum TaxID=995037 RepID=UPI000CF4CE42|nr:class I adenylate-forming enzyme family protein [Cryobacterium aureum]